jgi:CheY-like chemotaxis protein
VVDDHETNIRVLTRQLEMGMQVSSAASGERALQLMVPLRRRQLPDVVSPTCIMFEWTAEVKPQSPRRLDGVPIMLLTSVSCRRAMSRPCFCGVAAQTCPPEAAPF